MILEMVEYMHRDQAEIVSGLVENLENPEERMNADKGDQQKAG